MHAHSFALCFVVTLAAAGCATTSDQSDSAPPYALRMSRLAPSAANAEERRMLSVLPDGSYEMLHAPAQPKQGTLPQARLDELRAHSDAAAASALRAAAAASTQACFDSAEGYLVDIGDDEFASRTDGALCLLPGEVSGAARAHLDVFIKIFKDIAEQE